MAVFVATHGVQFADLDIQFTYDRERTGDKPARVYSVDLDTKQAAELKKLPAAVLKEYGIKPASKSDDDE